MKAFSAGAVYGILLWLFSTQLTGMREPWDGGAAWAGLALLLLGGFLHVSAFKAGVKMAYWSVYAGQFLFGFFQMVTGDGNLFPIGAVFLLVWTLPVIPGALIARKLLEKQPEEKKP